MRKEYIRTLIFFLEILVLFFVFAWITKDAYPLVDEGSYYFSITKIIQNKNLIQAFMRNPVIPGYVILISQIMRITNNYSLASARMISLIFSFFSMIVFFLIAKKTTAKYVYLKTLQYILSPLFFPFFFLLYTDIVSLFFVLLSFLCLINRKYTLSGIIAFVSIFIRQDNIFWIGFFCLYALEKKISYGYIKSVSLYIFSFLFLVMFFIANGGNVALGDKTNMTVSLHSGNIYLFFFLIFLLFLPLHVYNLKKIFFFLKNHSFVSIAVLLVSLSFFYLKIDHKYNQPIMGLFLRNQFFHLILINTQNKIIGYTILVWTILSCMVIPFVKKKMYILYAFSISAFAFHWLIEPRYIFPAIAFFILFKKEESFKLESVTLFFNASMTVVLILGIYMRIFFP